MKNQIERNKNKTRTIHNTLLGYDIEQNLTSTYTNTSSNHVAFQFVRISNRTKKTTQWWPCITLLLPSLLFPFNSAYFTICLFVVGLVVSWLLICLFAGLSICWLFFPHFFFVFLFFKRLFRFFVCGVFFFGSHSQKKTKKIQ